MPNDSSNRRGRRLRITGSIVLLLGITSAIIVYWLGTRSGNLSDDLSMTGFNRTESHQMGLLYGKSGLLMDDWLNDLKQPGTQAIVIAVVSLLFAGGCFYFARLLDNDEPR